MMTGAYLLELLQYVQTAGLVAIAVYLFRTGAWVATVTSELKHLRADLNEHEKDDAREHGRLRESTATAHARIDKFLSGRGT